MKGLVMDHPLPTVDPFDPVGLQRPGVRICACNTPTTNCSGTCDTCLSLESDIFGRVEGRHGLTDCMASDCIFCNERNVA